VLDALRIVMATIVVRTFLRLRQHSLLLDRLNFAIAIAAFFYALAMVLGAPLHHSWSREAAFIYVPLWIISAVVAWRHGEDRAPLFVIAWSALLLFSLSFALQQLFGIGRGNLIAELFISRGMYFGVGIQSVLLSLAFSTDLRHVARSRDQYARLATVDGLTGIANRRRFDTVLQDEWQRAQRGLRPLSLLMIDVDYFKAFNDRYGHAAGDTCLRHIAQTGEAGLQRNGGLFSRYGGEEFGVILPNTDATDALRVAEAFRQAIADQSTPHEDSPHGRITVSIGIATTRHEASLSPDELQVHADRALYAAKQQGRNRVSAAAPQWLKSLPLK